MTKPTVNLVKYNPNWKLQFEYEKKRINTMIGNKVVEIEHIGSTSIKGLDSKPIIDIMAGVQDLEKVATFVPPLSKIEYEYVPKPELTYRKFFRKGMQGQGTCHLHICEFNSSEWNEKLLFRDYLRLHPNIAQAYVSLKKELAANYKFDRPTYTMKKEPFIKTIIEKAKKGDSL
ncbi:GrpB family protein [Virgibacillus litoralis]|uniref:GrpB-like predicted nucleotidyltransferase (UPF0157 family) n=1 Tax=Virgibacillus litoralis TaxID=578221 RepID=A0ABS4H993_9BACI|nr:GrpB family protein [Virgibacillus litoralis]MBP1947448.1 GrpB-like predicted nucleotidyltransferase (UPF0157 family) [Virgibacillus litoralis]